MIKLFSKLGDNKIKPPVLAQINVHVGVGGWQAVKDQIK